MNLLLSPFGKPSRKSFWTKFAFVVVSLSLLIPSQYLFFSTKVDLEGYFYSRAYVLVSLLVNLFILKTCEGIFACCTSRKDSGEKRESFWKKDIEAISPFIQIFLLDGISSLIEKYFLKRNSLFSIIGTLLFLAFQILLENLISKLVFSTKRKRALNYSAISLVGNIFAGYYLLKVKDIASGVIYICLRTCVVKVGKLVLIQPVQNTDTSPIPTQKRKRKTLQNLQKKIEEIKITSDSSQLTISENTIKLPKDEENHSEADSLEILEMNVTPSSQESTGVNIVRRKRYSSLVNFTFNNRSKIKNPKRVLTPKISSQKNFGFVQMKKKGILRYPNSSKLIISRKRQEVLTKKPQVVLSKSKLLNLARSKPRSKTHQQNPRNPEQIAARRRVSLIQKQLEPIKEELEEYADSPYVQFHKKKSKTKVNVDRNLSYCSFQWLKNLFSNKIEKSQDILSTFFIDQVFTMSSFVLALLVFHTGQGLGKPDDLWNQNLLALNALNLLLCFFMFIHGYEVLRKKMKLKTTDLDFLKAKIMKSMLWAFSIAMVISWFSFFADK